MNPFDLPVVNITPPDDPLSSKPDESARAGYHIREIKRGTFGELSKVREELEEAEDFEEQGNKLGVLIELSDALGAMQGYLEKNAPGFTIYDLLSMTAATRRAFDNGYR